MLSWVDPRAPKNIADATAEVAADPSRTCERLCNRQKIASPDSLCCTTLWTPTLIIRNINVRACAG